MGGEGSHPTRNVKKLMSAAQVTLVAKVFNDASQQGVNYLSVPMYCSTEGINAFPGHPGYKTGFKKKLGQESFPQHVGFARAPHYVMTKPYKTCGKGWRWGEVGCMFFNPSLQCISSSASPIMFFTSISKSFNLPKNYF